MKPTKPTDFAAMVPKEFRDEVVAEVAPAQAASEQNKVVQRQAKRVDSMRAKHGRDPYAEAMGADDSDRVSAQLKADQQREEERKDAARREKRGFSPKTRRQRKADAWKARGDRLRRRMKRHIDKYTQKLKSLGQADADPQPISPDVHRIGELVLSDPDAHMARIHLAQLPPVVARRVIRAALRPTPYKGKRKKRGRELREPHQKTLDGNRLHWERPGRRRWTHPAAIRTIAIGCMLWRLSTRTKHKGFSRVVRGVPRGMVAALLQDPNTGVRPSVGALFGNLKGVPGIMRALEQAGFFQSNQPPGSEVSARDRGPSGYAFNVYWFPPFAPPRGEEPPFEEDEEIGRLAGAGLTLPEAMGQAPPPPS